MLSRDLWVRYQSLSLPGLGPACDLNAQNWLSEAERCECARYRDAARLRQWLAGRWLAKQLLSEQLVPWNTDWQQVEILSRDGQGRAVRPQVRVRGKLQTWCVSISHSRRGVLVGVSLSETRHIGVDLAEKEELNPQSLVFWFSENERERLRSGTPRQAAVCWAVKEAVYKAINTGESFVPRKFEVFPGDLGVYECHHEGHSLMDRASISVWDVDDHVAVTAILSDTSAALEGLPQHSGQQNYHVDLATRPVIFAGLP